MAKKDNDNFDFETEGKAKGGLNLDFLKNLTKQQKGIILIAAVAIVLVIAIVVVCAIVGANGGFSSNGDINGGGGDNSTTDGDGNIHDEVPDAIVEFYISSPPVRNLYNVGDEANYSGLTFFIRDTDRNIINISYDDDPDAFNITGFDSSVPVESQTITVECRGYTDTFTVKIEEPTPVKPTLVGITIDPMPQTIYGKGESLNLSGSYIVVEYSDGTTESIKLRMKHISGFDPDLAVGDHVLTVKYHDENGGYAETSFTITVTE